MANGNRLQDAIVVVAGSDAGTGQAPAIACAREGAEVAITYFKDRDGAEQGAWPARGKHHRPSAS